MSQGRQGGIHIVDSFISTGVIIELDPACRPTPNDRVKTKNIREKGDGDCD